LSGLWTALRTALALAWRHKWTYGVPVATLLAPATILALRLPDTYEATAVVQVRELTGGDDRGLLPGERSAQGYALVAMARDRVLARENVRVLAPLLQPGADPGDAKVLEEIAARVEYDRLSDYAFQLSITDTSSERAAGAVNLLLETFLESERRDPLERAESNLAHYRKELAGAQVAYDEASKEYEAFRASHADTLPDKKDSLAAHLAGLLAQRSEVQGRVARHRERVGELEQDLAKPPAESGPPVAGARVQRLQQQLSDQQEALSSAERSLAVVRSQFTDEHPAVKRALEQVEVLKRPLKDTERALDAARREDEQRWGAERNARLSTWQAQQRKRIEYEQGALERAEAELARVTRDIATSEGHLARVPDTAQSIIPLRQAVEQSEKTRLERERLVSDAASVVAFMRTQDPGLVTQYRIAQRAVPPAEPSGPRRKAWLLTALGLGLLIGYGLMVVQRRFAEPIVRSTWDLAGLLPGVLVVRVPALPERASGWQRVPWKDLALGGWVTLCLGVSALAILHHRGVLEAPALVQRMLGGAA
jgi:uncharacterized protein involved in exopolysaccharide biosynthesis